MVVNSDLGWDFYSCRLEVFVITGPMFRNNAVMASILWLINSKT